MERPAKEKQCYGKAALNKVLKVPIGTLIYRLPEGTTPFAPKLQKWELEEGERRANFEVGREAAAEVDCWRVRAHRGP